VSATPEAGVDLRGSNTLRLPCIAEWCADVQDAADIPRLLVFARERGLRLRVLGGGSNVLLPESLPGLLLRMRNTGIELLEDSASRRVLRAAAGEPWHSFVLHCHCWTAFMPSRRVKNNVWVKTALWTVKSTLCF
jgi:UDP-N-acetylmuramate dehydrogenase